LHVRVPGRCTTPSAAGPGPERTCYVGSLSKNVATGLRLGFAVVPGQNAAAVIRAMRVSAWALRDSSPRSPRGWLADGMVAQLEKTRRQDAVSRQDIARAALAGLDITAHPNPGHREPSSCLLGPSVPVLS
jgi:DNA-binding transcriptional MocR family regulator